MTSWVPSHVELTVHQARDLLLKTKSSSSVVYVTIVADRENSQSVCLPSSTAPLWQFTSKIPLMSLDTILFCYVRQKTSFKDKFLGLVSIPLRSFAVSSKPVTHWYKLGAKVGKPNLKLRGELLLSVRFLSDWLPEEKQEAVSPRDFVFGNEESEKASTRENGRQRRRRSGSVRSLSFRRKSMLKRTKSDIRETGTPPGVRRGGGGGGGGGEKVGGEVPQGKEDKGAKKEKSIFRRSTKKKTRSPVLEDCSDEFTSLSIPADGESPLSTSTPSQSILKENEGDEIFDGRTEYLTRSLDRKRVSNGHTRKSTNPTRKDGGASGGRRGGVEEKYGATLSTEKMSPALRKQGFRSKKRPWSMHTFPHVDDPSMSSSTSSPSTPLLLPDGETGGDSPAKVDTYRARSSLPRGISNGGRRVARPGSTIVDGNNRGSLTPDMSPLPLGSSDGHRNRSSGLGNVVTVSPSPNKKRSQSVSGTTGTPPTGSEVKSGGGGDGAQQNVAAIKSMGLGPRVPLATSLGDSPHRGSSGGGAAHLVSEDHSPRSSPLAPRTTGGGHHHHHHSKNHSPIHLQSTLVEEEEEEEEGGENGSTATNSGDLGVETAVQSRVPIETESAAFKVDASELEIVLEATPRRRSIVADPPSPVRRASSSSSSHPGSPVDSPTHNSKSAGTPSQESPNEQPVVLDTLTPVVSRTDTRAHSTSPIVTKGRGDSCLSGRSASTTALSGGGDGQDGIKHTAKERSSQDYEPIPALPPALSGSQTLPRHVQLSRRVSEPQVSSPAGTARSTPTTSGTCTPNHSFFTKPDHGLHNIRTFDPRIFEMLQQRRAPPPSQPKVAVTSGSFEETDSAVVSASSSPCHPSTQTPSHTRSLTPDNIQSPTKTTGSTSSSSSSSPAQNLSHTYPGGSPSSSVGQERGSGVAVGRKGGGGGGGGGGFQSVVSRYQENRRKSGGNRGSPSQRTSGDFGNVRLSSAEFAAQQSSSAGNSPVLRRASTHLGHTPNRSPEKGWRNPFGNLRRSQSHKSSAASPTGTNPSNSQGFPHHSQSSEESSSATPKRDFGSQGQMKIKEEEEEEEEAANSTTAATKNSNSNNELCGRSHVVATPTTTTASASASAGTMSSDTDSLRTYGSERTLVESGTDIASSSAGGGGGIVITPSCGGSGRVTLHLNLPPHKQTASSIDSEGLGSLASEEMEEAGPLEWAQWSKEELVRELAQTKSKLQNSDEELKAVRGYLDNLLLRIMETNPGMLSVGTP